MSKIDAKSFRGLQKEIVFSPDPSNRKRRPEHSADSPTRRTKRGRHEDEKDEKKEEQDDDLTLDSDDEKGPDQISFTVGNRVVSVDRASIFRDQTSGPELFQDVVQTQEHSGQRGTSPIDITVQRYTKDVVMKVLEILRGGGGRVPGLYNSSRGTESLKDIINPPPDMTQGQINSTVKTVEDLLFKDRAKFKKVFAYVFMISWKKLMDFMLAAEVIRAGLTDLSALETADDKKRVTDFVADFIRDTEMEYAPGVKAYFESLVHEMVDNRFVMTFKLRQDDVKNGRPIVLPYHPEDVPAFNGSIDWGDGTTTPLAPGGPNFSHVYSRAGDYTVQVLGLHDVPFGFNSLSYPTPRNRLIDIQRWGGVHLCRSAGKHFYGCENLRALSATDKPDLDGVTSLSHMFAFARQFNGDLSKWNVSSVTDMSNMFYFSASFQGDLSNWNVGNVTNMDRMFSVAKIFNSNLSKWDVSKVTSMNEMFSEAYNFTSDLSNWRVGNVTTMNRMFHYATTFTSDLSQWDVRKVRDMRKMFSYAKRFKSDLSGWEVGNVQYIYGFDDNSRLDYTDLPKFPITASYQIR